MIEDKGRSRRICSSARTQHPKWVVLKSTCHQHATPWFVYEPRRQQETRSETANNAVASWLVVHGWTIRLPCWVMHGMVEYFQHRCSTEARLGSGACWIHTTSFGGWPDPIHGRGALQRHGVCRQASLVVPLAVRVHVTSALERGVRWCSTVPCVWQLVACAG